MKPMTRFFLVLAALFPAMDAVALTDLLHDDEPNNTPHEALLLSLPSGKDAVRIVGELQPGDQDAFRVVVDEDLAGRRFDLEITGRGGALTQLDIFDFSELADGRGRIPETLTQAPRNLMTLKSETGARPGRIEGVLLAPGVYLFGISHSGGTGGYTMEVRQHDDRSIHVVDDDHTGDDPGRFNTRGRTVVWTQGETWFGFDIDENEAAQFRDLAFQVPLGRRASAELLDSEGNELLSLSGERAVATRRPGLKLAAGDYRLRTTQDGAGVQMFSFEVGAAPAADGREVEPNDREPTEFTPGESIAGRFDDGDTDWLAFEIGEEQAGRRFDLELTGAESSHAEVCLTRNSIRLSHCTRGSDGMTALRDLGLSEGRYELRLSDRGEPGSEWTLRWLDRDEIRAGEEVEPNNEVRYATAMHERGFGRGRFVGDEYDHWRFTVTGEPQLWRAQAQGDNLFDLRLKDASGRVLMDQRSGGASRIRLDNVFLLPGTYVLSARGTDSDYILRLQELGPPPEGMEREPNEGIADANRLRFGVDHVGTLSQASDADHYHFTLNGFERVGITVQPPVDGSIKGTLNAGDGTRELSRIHNTRDVGAALKWDMYLPPGDYSLALSAHEPSDAEYTIDFERLDYLERVADREPNDGRDTPAPFPENGRVAGRVGQTRRNHDWYDLPVVDAAHAITLPRQPGVRGYVYAHDDRDTDLTSYDHEQEADIATLEPGRRYWLCLSGDGEYAFDLSALLDEPVDGPELPLELAVQFEHERIQAFSPWSQTVGGAVEIVNGVDVARRVRLETHVTDVRWTVGTDASDIELDPGGSAVVPVTLHVPADVPARPSVQFSARVADNGGQAHARGIIRVETDAPPIEPAYHWEVPAPMRGGLNAASPALGGEPIGGPDIPASEVEKMTTLFDGLARIGNWTEYNVPYRRDGTAYHYGQPTVRLAGGEAVPVAGVLLNPTASFVPHGFLDEFDIALSSDGEHFETVFTGRLDPISEEQAFVFDRTVTATHARLIPRSPQFAYTHYGSMRLGEFKVVAEPGWRPDTGPFNLADPAHGGHLVHARPWLNTSGFDRQLLAIDGEAPTPHPRGDEQVEIVLGFHNARAALIDRLVIDPLAEGAAERRPTSVAISIALESPLGPWRDVAESELGAQSTEIVLDEPVRARYVRLVMPLPELDGWIELPDRIAVFEARGPSILGEWGFYSDAGPMEAADTPEWRAVSGDPDNTSREQARPLPVGETLTGRALLDQYSAWYRLDVPADRNQIRLHVAGRPTVEAKPRLFDADGESVEIYADRTGPIAHEWTAWVEPGSSYFVELYEPPRSVIFSWDTSASVASYLPFIANALLTYAETIEPGRDEVNLLPFGRTRPMLRNWAGHAYPLMQMLSAYPHETSSSSAELTLAVAARELAGRPGKKAVILLTDAATVTDAGLWPALAEGQPQVFAMKLSSEGAFSANPVIEVDLMQEWSRVRGGHFSYVTSFGALGRGFARAISRLKAPVDFTVSAEFEQVADPEPATIAVVAADEDGLAPDARGAVEIILDASGSMLKRMDGQRRIDIAKAAVRRTVGDTLPDGMPLALRVYGHREAGSCRTDLEIPLAPLDKRAFLERVDGIEAINLARTPIAASLAAVASDLGAAEGRRLVVLLTDGEETCEGDPAAAIAGLQEAGVDVRINIVGFAIDDDALKDQFSEWARLGGGEYLDAAEADALPAAMDRALQVPFVVEDETGRQVARGVVGGEPVEVTAGRYRVRVETAATRQFRNLRLAPGEQRELDLGAQAP